MAQAELPLGAGADTFFTSDNWAVVYAKHLPGRVRQLVPTSDLGLSPQVEAFLQQKYPAGIYGHQRAALERHLANHHVCLTTGTASGKSLPFYVAALETLARKPGSRVLVVYPLKALGREQEARWREAIEASGLDVKVARIDGQVPVSSRAQMVKNCRILIVTPDIVHAWLLSTCGQRFVVEFLQKAKLIIVDEVHNYSGVFGSNAALLFRRLQHLMALVGNAPQFVCASATIADPAKHLHNLLGAKFHLIGPDLDTSPRNETIVQLVTPPRSADLLSEVSKLLRYLALKTQMRFLAFVDSRKQAEQLSSIVGRQTNDDDDELTTPLYGQLSKVNVLPFRAGFEQRDRDLIQDRLSSGSLRGVVSTSALELGIDIPYLDCAVLIGVPNSLTSFYQRIGRIGRHKPGQVIVVNTGSVYDEAVFRDPEELFRRPLAEGALYLENIRIQYIHVLCLARPDGEHDQVTQFIKGYPAGSFTTSVVWPEGFERSCLRERSGEVPAELQVMKAECGDDPNHVYPLRDVESQYKVEFQQGPDKESYGSLSHSQLMREAYPGAARPLRVYRIWQQSKQVIVRKEKRYTTKPNARPVQVFPNMSQGSLFGAQQSTDLVSIECALQIRETVVGYKERRGNNEFTVSYPTDPAGGVLFDLPRFTRNYFTTGVLLTHPALAAGGFKTELAATIIYEAFAMRVPFERQDVSCAVDKHRTSRGPIVEGTPFIAIYDQTYGSLHLTSRLMDTAVLESVLKTAVELAENHPEATADILAALRAMHAASTSGTVSTPSGFEATSPEPPTAGLIDVILPGSKGIAIHRNNEEFEVHKIQYHSSVNGMAYRGRYLSTTEASVSEYLRISDLTPIPGESKLGKYDMDLGELVQAVAE